MASPAAEILNKVATAALTIAGLIFLPIQIAQQFESVRAGVVTAVLLGLMLGVPAAYHLIPGPVQRRFGLRRYQSPAVLLDAVERVTVDAEYRATIETTSTLVFLELPSDQDLVDIVDVLPHETVEETAYVSADSDAADVIRRSPSTLAIRWRPKSPIRRFLPYSHQTRYRIPSPYGDDGFYQVMYVDRDTGRRRWEFSCAHQVERAIAFTLPPWRSRVTLPYLFRRIISGRPRRCDQPRIEAEGHEITWEVADAKKGRVYVLFATYVGMHSRILAQAEHFSWQARLKRRLGALV